MMNRDFLFGKWIKIPSFRSTRNKLPCSSDDLYPMSLCFTHMFVQVNIQKITHMYARVLQWWCTGAYNNQHIFNCDCLVLLFSDLKVDAMNGKLKQSSYSYYIAVL